MWFALPSRATVNQLAGVALLACGNILTLYGAWQLRGTFVNFYLPFLLLCLPIFAVTAHFEVRGFQLSRLVGLPVRAGQSAWLSAAAFAVLGAGWVFVKGGVSERATAKAEAALKPPPDPAHNPSPGRESIETVVFVVVLVLMLKLFVVEAFVIPTGSMAETLYGYHKTLTCPECKYEFEVNASREADPPAGAPPQETKGYCCPNCRFMSKTGANDAAWRWPAPLPTTPIVSGDRVLVGKFLSVNDRGHVVVFKYPDAPQTAQTAQNYIKRLVGLPGETVAICRGDLYVTRGLTYPSYPLPDDDRDRWRAPYAVPDDRGGGRFRVRWGGPDFRYTNAAEALELFDRSRTGSLTRGDTGFEIVRKPDTLVMAERRIVYDNDHQSKNLVKAGAPPRWATDPAAGGGWAADDPKSPKTFTHTGSEFGWVRYRHLVPAGARDDARPGWADTADGVKLEPRKITNFQGFNAGFEDDPLRGLGQHNLENSDHWVSDLMLECRATAADGGAVVLELSAGAYRHRAEFDKGVVRVKRFPAKEEYRREDGNLTTRDRAVAVGADEFTLAERPSGVKAGTAHALRFANIDCRLRVWVDDQPIDFGGKADYPPPPPPTAFIDRDTAQEGLSDDDLERPAVIGASGGAEVSGLKLWRDTHYVNNTGGKVDTYYVQPGHYLCMGDNSSQSSDGRMWGLVPDRLMLGRAVFIFHPFYRVGFIR